VLLAGMPATVITQPPPCSAGLRGAGGLIAGCGPQWLGAVVLSQTKPGSTLQLDEQPSPLFVFWSSQDSPGFKLPSPHAEIGEQVLGAPLQINPGSTAQTTEQPSLFAILPSSQSSPISMTLSPQVGAQMLGTS
jgi:hypothetical protein